MSDSTVELSEAATELYDSVTSAYDMSDAEKAVLVAGLIALDESELCRRIVAEEGPVTKDRFDHWVRHPAAVHGRDCRWQFVQCLKQLGLADKYERETRES